MSIKKRALLVPGPDVYDPKPEVTKKREGNYSVGKGERNYFS